jgi:prophage DNA circulation protein
VTTNVNVAQNTADIATLSGTVTNNFNTLSGAIAGTNANLSTLSGTVASLATTMSALSGQIAALAAISHDTVTLGTANGLSLSGQVLSLALASVVQNGALSSTDWTTFNSKQNALTFGNITSGTPELTILNGTAATV